MLIHYLIFNSISYRLECVRCIVYHLVKSCVSAECPPDREFGDLLITPGSMANLTDATSLKQFEELLKNNSK